MCGIAGLFNTASALPDRARALDVLARMTGTMVHRGPDADGFWADSAGRCFLGHRRLSIIDTSDAGRQPMTGVDEEWVICFNGELYNFQELRPVLEREGVTFRGRTDTEVLIASIAHWGLEALCRFDGMFAFAAFNRKTGKLILARDPFGEKPLYYMELPGGGLAFASELQALEQVPGFDSEVSVDAMAEVLMFQYIGAPRTIYRSVKKLPPGHWLTARAGEPIRIGQYFHFAPTGEGFGQRSLADLTDELEDILVRSVKRRLISDVPLGAFLSGGVDSSVACALVRRKLDLPLKTFSIGFEGAPESEHEAARQFAAHLGTEHHDQILAPDTADFLLGIGRLLDEPNADSSCMPTYLLSRFARTQVTVALSGDGGDEMFGGYGRYFGTLDEQRENLNGARPGWRPGEVYYADRILVSTEKYIEELFGEVPSGLREHVSGLRAELDERSLPLACRLRRTDVENYMPGAVLPKVDRMSMQHSLEVRTPFLNTELARFAAKLPEDLIYDGKRGKVLLRELAYRYLPRKLIDLPKQGFGIPMSRWGREELLDVCSRSVEGEESVLRRALGPAAVQRFMSRQRSRGGFSTYQVWALAMLESWLREHPATVPTLASARDIETPRVDHDGEHDVALAMEQERSVTVPEVNVAAPRGHLGTKPRSVDFHAWPLGARLFAVLDDRELRLDEPLHSGSPDDARRNLVFDQLLKMMAACPEVCDGLVAGSQSALDGVSPIYLGRPGTAVGGIPGDTGARLHGATLLFPEDGFLETAGWHDFEYFRRLGVCMLVFLHPYRQDGTCLTLRLNAGEGWRSKLKLLRLARYGKGTRRFLGAHRHSGERHEAGPFPFIPETPGEELSHRFMLFEGFRQLPPVPTTHVLIERQGAGRYSIWSRRSVFSRSEPGRGRLLPRWLIENEPGTARLLPFVPAILPPPVQELSDFLGLLKARIEADQREPSAPPLRRGDRIVVLTHALPPGGAERQWCYLAAELKRQGYEVDFVCTQSLELAGSHYLPYLKQCGIPVHEVGRRTVLRMLADMPHGPGDFELMTSPGSPFGRPLIQLASLLNHLRPAAIFAQLDAPNLIAGAAGVLAGVPRIVMSFRNYNPTNFPYLTNAWFQPLYATLARSPRIRLSGNSRAANEDYAEWIGCPKESVALVPNAIRPDGFAVDDPDTLRALRASLALTPGTPVILGIFRLSEEKQPLAFVNVCARVIQEVPELRAFIVGVGPLERAVRNHIKELGLEAQIILLGRRDDVPALLAIASVVLLTSSFEGMPNVVMEAELMGAPVVATRTGGTPDVLRHGETGFLDETGDITGLAGHCVDLLRSPEVAQRMGEAGSRFMRSNFSCERMAERFLAVADGVLSESGTRSESIKEEPLMRVQAS